VIGGRVLGRSVVLDVRIPDDETTVALARRRYAALRRDAEAAGRRCDECGTVIIRSGMTASLGLACDVACYYAMPDRPGRNAAGRAR
jgi:hypothetical protein